MTLRHVATSIAHDHPGQSYYPDAGASARRPLRQTSTGNRAGSHGDDYLGSRT
ncbi:MAG: hypothetical protein AVDCRST_MAG29-761 [uncultured Nocardioidaceae bacterium]|uniref:Uncharacterized protein n=1 Tax=uncultured Nocardioidaceae bacterium TaxID=253824 RepID=A0A6J4L7V2_9ACTN|nr:MAG: hypothetical protein AVDCRST_MAG29-761 [uncultured Nocardioidaceae bacterium]